MKQLKPYELVHSYVYGLRMSIETEMRHFEGKCVGQSELHDLCDAKFWLMHLSNT